MDEFTVTPGETIPYRRKFHRIPGMRPGELSPMEWAQDLPELPESPLGVAQRDLQREAETIPRYEALGYPPESLRPPRVPLPRPPEPPEPAAETPLDLGRFGAPVGQVDTEGEGTVGDELRPPAESIEALKQRLGFKWATPTGEAPAKQNAVNLGETGTTARTRAAHPMYTPQPGRYTTVSEGTDVATPSFSTMGPSNLGTPGADRGDFSDPAWQAHVRQLAGGAQGEAAEAGMTPQEKAAIDIQREIAQIKAQGMVDAYSQNQGSAKQPGELQFAFMIAQQLQGPFEDFAEPYLQEAMRLPEFQAADEDMRAGILSRARSVAMMKYIEPVSKLRSRETL